MTDILEVNAIHTFINQFHILEGVSLTVPQGSITALLGRNGAGKTTTLRSIMGLNPPREGTIVYAGVPIHGQTAYQIAARGIGYVPEYRAIFRSLTVEENLKIAERSKNDLAKRGDLIFELFPDLKRFYRLPGGQLSGGQQQMLAIARALVPENRLLLVDEPSEGLAPILIDAIVVALRRLSAHVTILLVEQNFRMASQLADRYYIVDDGQTVNSGRMADLINDRRAHHAVSWGRLRRGGKSRGPAERNSRSRGNRCGGSEPMTAFFRRNRPLLVTLLIVLLVLVWMVNRFPARVSASILLSGLTLGALYFLVAAGLSLIFGLMDVLNFAHGVIFMIGAYFGFTAYANPRLLLNTLPFVLALLGGAQIGRWIGGMLPPRFGKRWLDTAALVIMFLLSGALLVFALRGFNITVLTAAASTVAGGAVATDVAQEVAAVFLPRIVLLTVSGFFLGLALSRTSPVEVRQKTRWPAAAIGAVLVAAAFAITPVRSPAEAFLLATSSNARFVLALLVGLLVGGGLGALVETSVIRPLYARPVYQVLLTLGLSYVGTELVRSVWGTAGFFMTTPALIRRVG